MDKKKRIIVILGPTSSGKTGLAVKLAHKYDGEIISADSRQVYKGMDVGTGKDLGEYWVKSSKTNARKETGLPRRRSPRSAGEAGSAPPRNDRVLVPYHLIDVVSPRYEFSLAKFKKLAESAIEDILGRGKLPIIAGGTGLYLQALVDNYDLSSVQPDKKLRVKLEKKTVPELFTMLKKINFKFANRLHESDQKNKRRLIRYLEIQKKIVYSTEDTIGYTKNKYNFLLIGLKWPREVLRERIYQRLVSRLEKEGMINEVERLHDPRQNKYGRGKPSQNKSGWGKGVSWKRLESFGLEYKHVAWYLQGKLEYDEMVEKLNIAIRQFAKRQMSWFRRWEKQGTKIHWVKDNPSANSGQGKIEKLVREFLK